MDSWSMRGSEQQRVEQDRLEAKRRAAEAEGGAEMPRKVLRVRWVDMFSCSKLKPHAEEAVVTKLHRLFHSAFHRGIPLPRKPGAYWVSHALRGRNAFVDELAPDEELPREDLLTSPVKLFRGSDGALKGTL